MDAVIVDLEDAITASPQADARAALASGPAADIWRKLWAPAIDDYLYRADKQRLSRSAQQLVTGASQLALNRLGFRSGNRRPLDYMRVPGVWILKRSIPVRSALAPAKSSE